MKVTLRITLLCQGRGGYDAAKVTELPFTPSTDIAFELPGLGRTTPEKITYYEDTGVMAVEFGLHRVESAEFRDEMANDFEESGWHVSGR